jgi:hypothetical protein
MKTAGFTARELRLQGCSLAALVAAAFDMNSVFKAGFCLNDIFASGCDGSGVVLVSCAPWSALKRLSLPLPLPLSHPFQRDGSNLHMTLHCHKVDDGTRAFYLSNKHKLPVPAGWHIADGTADDVRVCGAHAWQSDGLTFANGDVYKTAAYGAAPGENPGQAGAARDAAARRAETKLNFASRLEIGKKWQDGANHALQQDAQGELEIWS